MVLFQNCVRQLRSPTKMAATVQLRCYWKQLWSRWAITGSWEPLVFNVGALFICLLEFSMVFETIAFIGAVKWEHSIGCRCNSFLISSIWGTSFKKRKSRKMLDMTEIQSYIFGIEKKKSDFQFFLHHIIYHKISITKLFLISFQYSCNLGHFFILNDMINTLQFSHFSLIKKNFWKSRRSFHIQVHSYCWLISIVFKVFTTGYFRLWVIIYGRLFWHHLTLS